MNRGVFLDLNGTLVSPLKPDALSDLVLIPGAAEAVARLTAEGYVCPVVTVQSRIAKGLFSLAEFAAWFVRFAADLSAKGARVCGPYVCPHRFAELCPCKKPNRFLYERAAREHDIETVHSFVIGDSPDDMRAARLWGVRGTCGPTANATAPATRTPSTKDPRARPVDIRIESSSTLNVIEPASSVPRSRTPYRCTHIDQQGRHGKTLRRVSDECGTAALVQHISRVVAFRLACRPLTRLVFSISSHGRRAVFPMSQAPARPEPTPRAPKSTVRSLVLSGGPPPLWSFILLENAA